MRSVLWASCKTQTAVRAQLAQAFTSRTTNTSDCSYTLGQAYASRNDATPLLLFELQIGSNRQLQLSVSTGLWALPEF